MQQSLEPYKAPPDIERIYLEMLAEYAEMEKKAEVTSHLCRPNYGASTRTARGNGAAVSSDKPRRTMSGSIAQFASMYDGK